MNSAEAQLEQALIDRLVSLKYEHRADIKDRAALEVNFRQKFQELNRVRLTDAEFGRLLDDVVTVDVFAASQRLRTRSSFTRDDGTPLNYTLVNTDDWCKNTFEVVSQLRINTDYSHHRYDVILLINGVPVVQVELKTLGIYPRRAIEQIVEYKNDPGNGYTRTLLCFVQLFVVSNRDSTYYFANNNARHFAFNADERFLPIYEHARPDNGKVRSLHDFAESFLAKCTLGQTISRYMVLVASEQKLLMMRPYQIYAVKNIVECIEKNSGNGYVWHTTGSGKTLTSFKASTLLKANPGIEKCLFVVDRKDLDRQTRDEFNRFQEGCVEENTNTGTLVRRLLSEDAADKVIVCTIQKLGLALDENSKRNKGRERRGLSTYTDLLEPLRDKRLVFIFDECHRSQFGDNHKAIKQFFPRAKLFGFTGTPIFPENATLKKIEGEVQTLCTTEDLFQQPLHKYTITEAIEDGNVLKFHVDYFKPDGEKPPKPGEPLAKAAVVNAILDKHDTATGGRRFNALLATASINDAIDYYTLFEKAQRERAAADPAFVPLTIAAVFSPPGDVSADVRQLQEDLPQEQEDNKHDPDGKKAALTRIIAGFNDAFGTNHSINEFDLYYQDVQKRIKDQQYPKDDFKKIDPDGKRKHTIDLTIVVDMLLTGFDSKYLNTLYVDKNLKHHGLIQAFSRTNRVLNATKPYGHILDFRGQQEAVDAAIALFSGKSAEQAREIWLVDRAPVVIERLKEAKQELDAFLQSQGLSPTPDAVGNLAGDTAKAAFIDHFKRVQKLQTQLDQYTDLTPEQKKTIEAVLPTDDLRAFRGQYLETAEELRRSRAKTPAGDVPPSPADELDFEFVLFASATIDYDYIMKLITDYSAQGPSRSTMTREQLIGLIAADSKFIDERDAITDYVRGLTAGEGLSEKDIRAGYERFKAERAAREVREVAEKHAVPGGADALLAFVDRILTPPMAFDAEALTELLEPLGLSWRARTEKELALMADLVPLLKRRAKGTEIAGLKLYED
jgi:type I restriction enzyme R subunit